VSAASLDTRAKRIRLVLLDVDGVLTDATVLMHGNGTESKRFHIRDGAGIVWAMRAGLLVGLLSARESASTAQRAAQLGISIVSQGVESKGAEYARIIAELSLADNEVAYMGDDVLDVPVLRRVGLAAVPADAVAEARAHAHWVSPSPGGCGAVRELLELILKAQDRWTAIVRELSEPGAPS
jgi:3-deoxy-D-manno-octulosonate 8-phosphate phosphatase (KDO 8-P phosphatase)